MTREVAYGNVEQKGLKESCIPKAHSRMGVAHGHLRACDWQRASCSASVSLAVLTAYITFRREGPGAAGTCGGFLTLPGPQGVPIQDGMLGSGTAVVLSADELQGHTRL